MSDDVISVENLGKKYRIRHQANRQRYVALRDVLTDRARSALHAPRSLARRLWSLTSRTPHSALRTPHSEDFWALKDVSFEVKQGEILGIIGRNVIWRWIARTQEWTRVRSMDTLTIQI